MCGVRLSGLGWLRCAHSCVLYGFTDRAIGLSGVRRVRVNACFESGPMLELEVVSGPVRACVLSEVEIF